MVVHFPQCTSTLHSTSTKHVLTSSEIASKSLTVSTLREQLKSYPRHYDILLGHELSRDLVKHKTYKPRIDDYSADTLKARQALLTAYSVHDSELGENTVTKDNPESVTSPD